MKKSENNEFGTSLENLKIMNASVQKRNFSSSRDLNLQNLLRPRLRRSRECLGISFDGERGKKRHF